MLVLVLSHGDVFSSHQLQYTYSAISQTYAVGFILYVDKK